MRNLSKRYYHAEKAYALFDYDIILIAGQSNAQGYGKGHEQFKYIPHDPIYGYTQGVGFHPACDGRYNHNDCAASFALYFGQEYCDAGMLKGGRKLLLLNTAVGGTGFSDNRWGENNDLYIRMLALAKKILALNSKNRITAFLWHQGETDALNHMSGSEYSDKLRFLITDARRILKIENIPFISGNMVPVWMTANPASYQIARAASELMRDMPLCGFVQSDGLIGNATPDIIHFSRKSCVELGKRYFEAYKKLSEAGRIGF